MPPKEFGKTSSIWLTLTKNPIVSLINANNISIKNIIIENTCGIGIYEEQGNKNKIENVTLENIGTVGIVIGKGVEPDNGYRHHYYTGRAISMELGSLDEHLYNDISL